MKQKVYTTPTEKNGNKNLIEQSLELNSSISLIEGVGSVRQKILNECGIFTLNDLFFHRCEHGDEISIKISSNDTNTCF